MCFQDSALCGHRLGMGPRNMRVSKHSGLALGPPQEVSLEWWSNKPVMLIPMSTPTASGGHTASSGRGMDNRPFCPLHPNQVPLNLISVWASWIWFQSGTQKSPVLASVCVLTPTKSSQVASASSSSPRGCEASLPSQTRKCGSAGCF